jgi:hypothetical protein
MKGKERGKRKSERRDLWSDTAEFRRELVRLFSSFLENQLPQENLPQNSEISINNQIVDLRNRVLALFLSWIGSKKIEQKFGIEIPLHSRTLSLQSYFERQNKRYRKCEVGGEDRITNWCHILPSSEGGPSHPSNYVYLCPTHHHLFDHNRLAKEEGEKLDFSKKLKAAREYVEKVRLPLLKKFWKSGEF